MGSQIVSGGFDFVSMDDEPFARALVELGFEQGDGRPDTSGDLGLVSL